MTSISSHVFILFTQVIELFEKDEEVWLCWRICVTGAGFEILKESSHPHYILSASYLLKKKVPHDPGAMTSLYHCVL